MIFERTITGLGLIILYPLTTATSSAGVLPTLVDDVFAGFAAERVVQRYDRHTEHGARFLGDHPLEQDYRYEQYYSLSINALTSDKRSPFTRRQQRHCKNCQQ